MNKKLLILPISLLLVSITSCGDNSSLSSNGGNAGYLKDALISIASQAKPYIIRSSTDIFSNGSIVSSTYSNYEVNTETNIKHNYGTKAIINGVEDPSGKDSKTKAFNIYYTPSKTYTLGDDGKYSIKEEENTIKVFSIGYNFNYIQDVNGNDSSFTTSVLKADTASFFTKSISDINSDVTIKGGFKTTDGVTSIDNLEFSYTTVSSYTCKITINYEYLMPNISLPTV